jgi:hypothetical protein
VQAFQALGQSIGKRETTGLNDGTVIGKARSAFSVGAWRF